MTTRQLRSVGRGERLEADRILLATKREVVRTESKFARSRFLGNQHDENDIYFNSEHSLEDYHPPYSYWEAMRPEIVWTEDLEEPLGYNQQLQFEVRGTSNAPPERVGLIRNSAVTHGVDMSQRYVELARFEEFEPVEGTGNRKYTARMLTPRDPYYAPPGYYMMSVVLEDGSVSHAVWIRLTQ